MKRGNNMAALSLNRSEMAVNQQFLLLMCHCFSLFQDAFDLVQIYIIKFRCNVSQSQKVSNVF